MERILKKEGVRISCCTGPFRGFSLEKTLQILKKIGFDYFEGTTDGRAHLYEYIFNHQDQEHLKKLLAKYQIKLGVVSGGWSDFAVNDKYLERQYQSLRKQLAFCRQFQVKILRIFASHLPGQYLNPQIIKRLIRNLKRIIPEAKTHNVCLAIENHYGATAKASDILHLIESVASPYLKVNFDAANFVPMNEDPVSACQKLLPYIAHLHLKDVCSSNQKPDPDNAYLTGRDIWRGYQFCALGKGLIHYERILNILLKNNYQGFYSIEYENLREPLRGTKASLISLKRILKTLSKSYGQT